MEIQQALSLPTKKVESVLHLKEAGMLSSFSTGQGKKFCERRDGILEGLWFKGLRIFGGLFWRGFSRGPLMVEVDIRYCYCLQQSIDYNSKKASNPSNRMDTLKRTQPTSPITNKRKPITQSRKHLTNPNHSPNNNLNHNPNPNHNPNHNPNPNPNPNNSIPITPEQSQQQHSSTFYRYPYPSKNMIGNRMGGGIVLEKMADQTKFQIKYKELQMENCRLMQENIKLKQILSDLLKDIGQQQGQISMEDNFRANNQDSDSKKNKQSINVLQNRCQKLQALTTILQSQNQILIKYKNTCLQKISTLTEHNQSLSLQLTKQKKQTFLLSNKLQQFFHLHLEDEDKICKLQKIARQANEQLYRIVKDTKIRDQEIESTHEKFHREMGKMKEKLGRCRGKMDGYRKERDQLALEIQRAKLEIGAVTLRKYFPDDSDDD